MKKRSVNPQFIIKSLYKLSLLYFLFAIKCGCINAQQPLANDIYIIGVFHNANQQRTHDSLLNLVKSIDPNIILSEMDTTSGMFRKDYMLRNPPWWYPLAVKLHLMKKMVPEHALLYSYKEMNDDIIIYPFDIAIPKRSKYVKRKRKFESSWASALNKANAKGEIPELFHDRYTNYLALNNYLYNLREHGYSFLNRPEVTDSLRLLMQVEYDLMPDLIDTIERLKPFRKKYIEDMNYWQHRNEVMAINIRYFAGKHPGKRIVVITGLLHKYILLDLLNEHANQGYQINVKG